MTVVYHDKRMPSSFLPSPSSPSILRYPSSMRYSFSILLFLILFFFSIAPVSSDTLVWFLQGVLTQKCRLAFEYYQGFGVVALKSLPINAPYSYNIHNTTGLLSVGYAFPCQYIRQWEMFYDKECNDDDLEYGKGIRPFGCVMYNPDMRKGDWQCLGEEPRIARYHASYATITIYDKPSFYTDTGYVDHQRRITCSSVCVIGGQQVTWYSNLTTSIAATSSVICGTVHTVVTPSGPVHTMNWTEVQSLPYTLVGATAIYSNGTLLVIGGLRGQYDETTSAILEADIDSSTCLPTNWRNYGYSSSSRIGNQKSVQNWSLANDVFENRTLVWATEGPPAYPKLTGDIIYDAYPRVYPPSYYPTVLAGGGVRIPNRYAYTPDTYTTSTFYLTQALHDNYYIPFQPIINNSTLINSNSTYSITQKKIIDDLTLAGNPAVPINLNVPFTPNNWLDQLFIFDRTLLTPTKTIEAPSTFTNSRRYEWLFVNGQTMYYMFSSGGDILSSWQVMLHEPGQPDGEIYFPVNTLPAVTRLTYTFIGNTGDLTIMAVDASVLATYTAYLARCTSCTTGINYMSNFCRYTPFEGVCTPCTRCDPDRLSNPTYQVQICTRIQNARCAKCRSCLGGPAIRACNLTADTECDPELEALALTTKWKRIPVSEKDDTLYLGISFSIFFLWLFVCSSYSIHKTQFSGSNANNTSASTTSPPSAEKPHPTAKTTDDFSTSIQQIIRSSPFRRALSSIIQHTFQLLSGYFTVFTYVFFNLCLLYSIQAEEGKLTNGTVTDNLFMGSILRESTYRSTMITVSFLILSVLLNGLWIVYHYRVLQNLPFYFYLIFPWVSFHHRLLLWMHRTFLLPLLVNRKMKGTTIIMNNGLTKPETFGLTLLYVTSSLCADGVQLLILFSLSDNFGATMSSARPLTVGVGICSLVNTVYSLRRLYVIVFTNNNGLLSKGSRLDSDKGINESDPSDNTEVVDFVSVITPANRNANPVPSANSSGTGSKIMNGLPRSTTTLSEPVVTVPTVGPPIDILPVPIPSTSLRIPSSSAANPPIIPASTTMASSLVYLDPTQMNFSTISSAPLRSNAILSPPPPLLSHPTITTTVRNPVYNNNAVLLLDPKPLENGPCTPPWRHTVSEHGLAIDDNNSHLLLETVSINNRRDRNDGTESYVSGRESARTHVLPVVRNHVPSGALSSSVAHVQQRAPSYASSSAASSSSGSSRPQMHALDRYKRVEEQLSKSINETKAPDDDCTITNMNVNTGTTYTAGYFTYVIEEKSSGSLTDQTIEETSD